MVSMSRVVRICAAVMTRAILVASCLCSSVIACPTCKEGLGNSSNLVNGYGWSIMFMMSAPFLILAGVGGYFYYEICKARAAQRLAPVANRPDVSGA